MGTIVPVVPGFKLPDNFTPKSFWKRPEGGAGKGLIVALFVALGAGLFWFWGTIVPFVLTTIQDTFWAIIYLIGISAILDVLLGITPLGKRVKNLIKNMFQSTARAVATLYTTIDPIGILRNTLDDMKNEKQTLDTTVQRFAGSNEKLVRSIAQTEADVNMSGRKAEQASKMAQAEKNPIERERLAMDCQTILEDAGMKMQGLQQLKALQAETAHMLETFQHWSMVADSKIKRTENKVNFLAKQRAMIMDAKSTLAAGQRILKGNPEQLAMYDMALEFLEDDTARTLGEIREFTRFTDKLLTDDKIEAGANAELAKQEFAKFKEKLLASSNAPAAADLIQIPGIPTMAPQAVMAAPALGSGVGSKDDYDPFK
jgi:hypothetical protein